MVGIAFQEASRKRDLQLSEVVFTFSEDGCGRNKQHKDFLSFISIRLGRMLKPPTFSECSKDDIHLLIITDPK